MNRNGHHEATLRDLTTLISSGSTPLGGQSVYLESGPVMLVRSQNVRMNRLDLSDVAYISDEIDSQMQRSVVQHNDVLLNITGASIGRVARFELKDTRANVNQHVCIIRPKPDELESRYLEYFLSSPAVQHDIHNRHQHGGTRQALTFAQIGEFSVPLPPLSEQKRIADILDKADAIRRKRQEALRLNNDVIYSVYQEWFGNPITNPKGFPTRTIDEMCNLVRGSSPRPKSDPRYFGGPVPRLMVEDITRDGRLVTPQIDSLTEEGAKRSRPCPAGTVVMVVSGNVGLPARLAIDACIHDGFVGLLELDTRLIRPDFLVLTLEMLKVTHERFKAGAIWQNLTTHQIKAMEVPLPPLEEQDAFDQFVSRHNEFTTRLKQKGSEEEDIFNSLVQRAFKGEL